MSLYWVLKLEDGVGVLQGEQSLHAGVGPRLDVVIDVCGHVLKRPGSIQSVSNPEILPNSQNLNMAAKLVDSLDVDGSHVLKDAAAEPLAPVGHGAVLESSGEHQHVAGLAFHLDGVLVEVLRVIGVAGQLVGVGPEGSATVTRVEVSEEGDKLDGEGGGVVEDVGVCGWEEHAVVGVVKVGELATVAGQHGVGGIAGDRTPLPQHYVTDVQHDGVQGHLLEDLALVEEGPHHAVEVVVFFVLGRMVGVLPES